MKQHQSFWYRVFLLSNLKVKVKCTLVHALRLCTGRTAHRGSRGIALPFHDLGTRRGWGVSFTPRPLFTPGKTRYPLYRRLSGPQGRSGHVRKISPPTGFDPRMVQPVASRYTNYATRPTFNNVVIVKFYLWLKLGEQTCRTRINLLSEACNLCNSSQRNQSISIIKINL